MTNETAEMPTFVYAMVPAEKSSFRNFYETGPIKKLLETPGQLRTTGWDLTTGGRARIVRGEYLEIKSAERKILQLYEDGTFIVKVSASEDFLAWGQNTIRFRSSPRLNPLAIIEFTLNFVILCSELVKYLRPEPSELDFRIEIRQAIFDGSKLHLNPNSVMSESFMFDVDGKEAEEPSMSRDVRMSAQELKLAPAAAAFILVQKIYAWFGIPSEQIPYVSVQGDRRYIDQDLIRSARSS